MNDSFEIQTKAKMSIFMTSIQNCAEILATEKEI